MFGMAEIFHDGYIEPRLSLSERVSQEWEASENRAQESVKRKLPIQLATCPVITQLHHWLESVEPVCLRYSLMRSGLILPTTSSLPTVCIF